MIKTLRLIIIFFIYSMINIFIKPSKVIKPKSILLVRLDAIGDYVLFRNIIQNIKSDIKFKDYSLTLLGNISWKSLSEELDGELVDDFIWLDRNRFQKDIFYRYKKLQELTSKGYEILISPVYSRELFIADSIVKLITAQEKIGSVGDCTNIKKWQKDIGDKYYDTLIPVNDEPMFEFNRNKEFFENILENKIDITKPVIKNKQIKLKHRLPEKYAILFIGASSNLRKWSTENFSKAGNYLNSEYGYDIVICGSSNDSKEAKLLERQCKDKVVNLAGKTSLIELVSVISHGDLILSNDTLAPHIAVTLDVSNIFVLFNGNHFGRFAPYPREICENHHVIYHPSLVENLKEYKNTNHIYQLGSDLCINDISFKMVKKKIDEVLQNSQV